MKKFLLLIMFIISCQTVYSLYNYQVVYLKLYSKPSIRQEHVYVPFFDDYRNLKIVWNEDIRQGYVYYITYIKYVDKSGSDYMAVVDYYTPFDDISEYKVYFDRSNPKREMIFQKFRSFYNEFSINNTGSYFTLPLSYMNNENGEEVLDARMIIWISYVTECDVQFQYASDIDKNIEIDDDRKGGKIFFWKKILDSNYHNIDYEMSNLDSAGNKYDNYIYYFNKTIGAYDTLDIEAFDIDTNVTAISYDKPHKNVSLNSYYDVIGRKSPQNKRLIKY